MRTFVAKSAVYVAASPTNRLSVLNEGTGKIFYAAAPTVSESTYDGTLESGEQTVLGNGTYLLSASKSDVSIEPAPFSINPPAAPLEVWGGNYEPLAVTSGTDVAFAEKKLFTTSVWLPVNKTITGVAVLLGTEGTTNKLVAGLFDATGRLLAKSSETEEGTTAAAKETIQKLAFTTPYIATGPALYFIGVTGNGTTAKLRTIPTATRTAIYAAELSLSSKNVLANITPPSTFTGGKGMVGCIY